MEIKNKIMNLAGVALFLLLIAPVNAQKINQINHVNWDNLPWDKLTDKLYRKYIYGSSGMVATFKMDEGVHIPQHFHPNEQITYITKGSVRVVMNGKDHIVKAGEVLIVPPNQPHEFFCLENGTIDVDFFPTLRMDWLTGSANYFGSKAPELETVATLDIRPGNVAVAPNGRVFATIHPLGKSSYQLVEIQKDKSYKPYPSIAFQKNGGAPSASKIDTPLGLTFDKKGRLWVTDMGLELGSSRIWIFDVEKNKLLETITIPEKIAPKGSFNQDLAVDDKNNWVYLADISNPGIIAGNIKTKQFRRFGAHQALKAEDKDMYIDGKLVHFGGKPARVAIDPITISDDGETIFFGAMNGDSWYSVPSRLFRENASDEAIASAIKRVGPKPICDGAFTDKQGNHYFTNLQEGAITKLSVEDGELYNIVKDPSKLKWPDNIYIRDGYIYICVNQLNTTPAFTGSEDKGNPPYHIYRYKI